jgi:hypothetical protein
MEEEKIPDEVPEEIIIVDDGYLDPLLASEYIVTNMDIVANLDFIGKVDCLNDLANVLKKCNDVIFLQLSNQFKELKKKK